MLRQTESIGFEADALSELAMVPAIGQARCARLKPLDQAIALYKQKGNVVALDRVTELRNVL